MSQRIKFINTGDFLSQIWSASDIREESPEDADGISDDMIGVLLATGDGDGALVIGTVEEVYSKLQWALGKVILQAKPGSTIFQ